MKRRCAGRWPPPKRCSRASVSSLLHVTERELLLTGIGGQGVQLAAQVVARASVLEGRHVMLFGVYAGVMRGGNSDATVVVADETVQAPPIVSRAWSALALHARFWEPLAPRLAQGAVVVLNSSLFDQAIDRAPFRVFDVPASHLAA